MEPVVYEETPFADYLRGEEAPSLSHGIFPFSSPRSNIIQDEGDESQADWAPGIITPEPESSAGRSSPSPPSSPSPFAPTGRPLVKPRFRNKAPNALQLKVPQQSGLRSASGKYSVCRVAQPTPINITKQSPCHRPR
jgi:hypothetical protein